MQSDANLLSWKQGPCKIQPDKHRKERAIEEFIEKNPKCLRDDLFIIGRQVKTADGGIIDPMGLDTDGNVAVIEIKKRFQSAKDCLADFRVCRMGRGAGIRRAESDCKGESP